MQAPPVALFLPAAARAALLARLHPRRDEVLHLRASRAENYSGVIVFAPATRAEQARAPVELCVYRLAAPWTGVSHLRWAPIPDPQRDRWRVDLALNAGAGASAALRREGRVEALNAIVWVGNGAELWEPGQPVALGAGERPRTGRGSRLAGALGGTAVAERLAALRVAVRGDRSAAERLREMLEAHGAPPTAKLRLPTQALVEFSWGREEGDEELRAKRHLVRLHVALWRSASGIGLAAEAALWLPGAGCPRCFPIRAPRASRVRSEQVLDEFARAIASERWASFALACLERLAAGAFSTSRRWSLAEDGRRASCERWVSSAKLCSACQWMRTSGGVLELPHAGT